MMGAKAFVDTNVLIRALHSVMPQHDACRRLIEAQWDADVELWISRQVIREYLVQATHPNTFQSPLTKEQLFKRIDFVLSFFRVADENNSTTKHLVALLENYAVGGKQIHDANLVATMLANDIRNLLTLNTEDFKRYNDKINILNP